ncbi:recombinase family protein [Chloroflexota bacterium]
MTNIESKRAVIYARVSSERQDVELSISAQLRALRDYAHRSNYEIYREFVDEAESGRSVARPAFKDMIRLARAKQPPFEIIIVWKLNRFARSREDSIIYKSLLRKQGIQVISVNEPLEDTPAGRMLEGIIEVIDEFYSANLAQDVTRGMRESAMRGYFSGGQPPYGYDITKVKDGIKMRSTLIPNPITAPIVKRMYEESLNGKGLREIARGLNHDGILTPKGKIWVGARIHNILSNEAYIGTLVWGKRSQTDSVKVSNAWPTIVEKDVFDRVIAVLKSRGPKIIHPRRTVSEYLLSGLMKCGVCGKSMSGHSAKSGQFLYYRCSNATKRGAAECPGHWIPKPKIEGFIIDKIRNCILAEDNLIELVRLTNEELGSGMEFEKDRLNTIERQIDDIDSRLENLYDALEKGSFESDELAPRIRKLKARRDELLTQRNQTEYSLKMSVIESPDINLIREHVDDIKQLLSESPIIEQRAFLKSFVKNIEVGKEAVTVNYHLPMPPAKSDKDVMGVLPFITNGRPCRSRTCDTLIKRYKRFIPESNDK